MRSTSSELGTLRLRHLQSVPTSHPDLRLTQFTPADEETRAALGGADELRGTSLS